MSAPTPLPTEEQPLGRVTAPGVVAVWQPLSRWAVGEGLPPPRLVQTLPTVTYELQAGPHRWVFQVGSTVAHWNGLQVRLGYAPQWVDQEVWMHGLDLTKQVRPLLGPVQLRLQNPPRIVLDPGHGGQNTGARSIFDGRWEKDLTLDWALRVRAMLISRGWQVILTRQTDVDVPLSRRVQVAEEAGADVFLSFHFNAVENGNHVSGLETYCLTPTGMPSSIQRGFEDDPTTIHPNNAWDDANFQLAVLLHRVLQQHTGLADRGVRRARFMTVLQGQNRPAVLLEGGYLTHPEDARRIADPAFRHRLAEAVVEALSCLREGSLW